MQITRLRKAAWTTAALARSSGAGLCWALALLPVAPAEAQSVQRCRVDGAVVFQGGPCRGGEAEALRPPARQGTAVSLEKPVATSGGHKRTLGELLRQRDGDRAAREEPEAPRDDASTVLPARMGAV